MSQYAVYVTRWMYKGSSRFCEGLEVCTRRDAAQGMFRRVGRTHTGGGKTWWPTGCGIHQRRCSAYLLRSRLFYPFPCTRVPRHEEGREKGEREKGRRASGSLWEKLHWNYRRERSRLRVGSLCAIRFDPWTRNHREVFTPSLRRRTARSALSSGSLLNHAWRARPAIYKAARIRNDKRRHKESAFLSYSHACVWDSRVKIMSLKSCKKKTYY